MGPGDKPRDAPLRHANSSGSLRGPRTEPSDQVTSPARLELGDALEELLDRDRHLHARQVRADAAVDAEAEGGVAVLLAVDDHLVGVGEHGRVAVGGRERQQHHLALP